MTETEVVLHRRAEAAEKLAEYRLQEIRRLMTGDKDVVTVFGVPLDHYANFLVRLEESAGERADKVLARLAELENSAKSESSRCRCCRSEKETR